MVLVASCWLCLVSACWMLTARGGVVVAGSVARALPMKAVAAVTTAVAAPCVFGLGVPGLVSPLPAFGSLLC